MPYTLAPGTPKDRVIILPDVMLTPEDMDKAIRELPRDCDVVELFKKLRRRRSTAAAVTQTNKDLSSVARADD